MKSRGMEKERRRKKMKEEGENSKKKKDNIFKFCKTERRKE